MLLSTEVPNHYKNPSPMASAMWREDWGAWRDLYHAAVARMAMDEAAGFHPLVCMVLVLQCCGHGLSGCYRIIGCMWLYGRVRCSDGCFRDLVQFRALWNWVFGAGNVRCSDWGPACNVPETLADWSLLQSRKPQDFVETEKSTSGPYDLRGVECRM